jgi:hypothetical protein
VGVLRRRDDDEDCSWRCVAGSWSSVSTSSSRSTAGESSGALPLVSAAVVFGSPKAPIATTASEATTNAAPKNPPPGAPILLGSVSEPPVARALTKRLLWAYVQVLKYVRHGQSPCHGFGPAPALSKSKGQIPG